MKNNMQDLNLLKTFCKVAHLGSFSKAALELKQPKSRVSRAISRLEDSLKTQLIMRTTRSFSLTDQGQKLFTRLKPLLDDLALELNRIDAQSEEVSGLIRITAPDDVAQYLLAGAIQRFNDLYPRVQFSLELSNDVKDLTSDNFDIAFRLGKLKDSTYVQSLLKKINIIFLASSKYLSKNGTPKKKTDLLNHKVLVLHKNQSPMQIKGLSEQPSQFFSCSNFPFLYQMVKAGYGIGLVPDFYCVKEVESQSVVQLFSDWQVLKVNLHLVYPTKKNLPKRVRIFIDFVKNEFKQIK